MKRMFLVLLIVGLIIPLSFVFSDSPKITITMQIGNKYAYINGKPLKMDVAPIEVPPGRTMVPIRFVAEGLGAEVGWNEKTETVAITLDSIPFLKSKIEDLEAEINSLNETINESQSEIEELNKAIKDKNSEIEDLKDKIEKYQNEDKEPPKVVLFENYDNSTSSTTPIYIKGKVYDVSGVEFLRINGGKVSFDKLGNFDYKADLIEGLNKISIECMDAIGNKTTKIINVTYRKPKGTSVNSPVPMGESYTVPEGLEITVLKVTEGRSAWWIIYKANQFNDTPEENMKYVIVTLKIKNRNLKEDYLKVSYSDFKLVGSSKKEYSTLDKTIVLPDSGEFKEIDDTLFKDGEIVGSVAFYVSKEETDYILVWDKSFSFENTKRYFEAKIPEEEKNIPSEWVLSDEKIAEAIQWGIENKDDVLKLSSPWVIGRFGKYNLSTVEIETPYFLIAGKAWEKAQKYSPYTIEDAKKDLKELGNKLDFVVFNIENKNKNEHMVVKIGEKILQPVETFILGDINYYTFRLSDIPRNAKIQVILIRDLLTPRELIFNLDLSEID